jgi:soluble lytic murein transglycosylase-like protein
MRGTNRSISAFPAARALLAGAAILAGAASPRALAQPLDRALPGSDDTALAIPRVAPRDKQGVALPQPLPPSEAARIRQVFALQRAGDLHAAAREAALLDPDIAAGGQKLGQAMQGYILADRDLGPYTRAQPEELQSWLAKWPDLADAPAMQALLTNRLPATTRRKPAPAAVMLVADDLPAAPATSPVPEETEPVGQMPLRNPALDRAVSEAARTGRAGAVQRLLARTDGLSPVYAALLRGEAAQILFTLNRDEDAYAVAAPAAHGCGRGSGTCRSAALAGVAGGLAAWRMHRPDLALPMFEAGWRAELSTSALRATAAFWAARAHLRVRDPAGYVPWMQHAAAERRTFYGMLALRTLGLDIGFGPGGRDVRETLGEADIEAVAATPQGMRAFALLQVGQDHRAEAELRRLWPSAQGAPALGRAVMLVAERAGLVELAAQLADLAQTEDGRPRYSMRFPLPRLRPAGGFRMDPALVYGITRTESNFNADLASPAGAVGLMQIMPDTASFITGAPATASLSGRLRDPSVNLDLGQRYVTYLAGQDAIGGDLLRLLASYNAGPGAFARWAGALHDDGDPLLFIEAIPIDETRAYIPRVLAYTWIYAARMHLPTPSLDELAAGGWPRYHPLETRQEPPGRLH